MLLFFKGAVGLSSVIMRKIKIFFLLTGILVAGCCYNVAAKDRPEKTSSARAAYGYSAPKTKIRAKNKQKVNWAVHYKPAKGTTRHGRAKAWTPIRWYN